MGKNLLQVSQQEIIAGKRLTVLNPLEPMDLAATPALAAYSDPEGEVTVLNGVLFSPAQRRP